jgi:hypothetical protein
MLIVTGWRSRNEGHGGFSAGPGLGLAAHVCSDPRRLSDLPGDSRRTRAGRTKFVSSFLPFLVGTIAGTSRYKRSPLPICRSGDTLA